MLRAKDIPLVFAAITISLLLFAIVWTAPSPQLCSKEVQQSRAEYQRDANDAVPGSRAPANHSNNECDEHAITDWWAIRIGLVTALILAGQLGMFWQQLRAMRDGVKDAAVAAQAALTTATAALSTAETARHAERAYFQISHRDGMATAPSGEVAIPMQIRNWGKTPGTIIDRRLGLRIWSPQDPLPTNPPYEELPPNPIAGAFLVPTGIVTWDEILRVSESQMRDINNGDSFLVLFGYVDYEDRFRGRHRAGYARQYLPVGVGSGNLVFVTVPGYNSDLPIG